MNSHQAKNIDLPDLLQRMGYHPVKITKGGNELFYMSPFRKEKEPSFHVSRGQKVKWVWCDFGDTNGTVIDFVMRHEGCDFQGALRFLESVYERSGVKLTVSRVGDLPSNQEPSLFSQLEKDTFLSSNGTEDRDLEFLSAVQVTNPLIHDYLAVKRGIPRSLIDRYILEIRYKNKKSDKEYFAFGMKNESEGYEIRAASDEYSFKSALKARDITLIPGSRDRKEVNVMEGMTDFLSLCAMYNTSQLANDTIIMHSTSSYSRAVSFIRQKEYSLIHSFMDNDSTGEKTTARFKEDFPDQVEDQSELYRAYKDLNDAWLANLPKIG